MTAHADGTDNARDDDSEKGGRTQFGGNELGNGEQWCGVNLPNGLLRIGAHERDDVDDGGVAERLKGGVVNDNRVSPRLVPEAVIDQPLTGSSRFDEGAPSAVFASLSTRSL